MKQQPAKKQTTKKSKTSKTSTKAAKRSSKDWRVIGQWYIAVPLAILIILLAGYLARGWIRYHAEPALVSWSSDNTNKVLNQQMDELKNPLSRLGITNHGFGKQCNLLWANDFRSEFICNSSYQGYLSDVRGLSPNLASRASSLEVSLRADGWSGGGTTINQLGAGISQGIDYIPDAYYTKQVGDYVCVVSFATAFSKPKPPALSGLANCSKDYRILGGPAEFTMANK